MDGSRARATRSRGWSVRTRIMGAILAVAALGLVAAGGTAFLVQRERVIAQVDERLSSHLAAARFVVTGESMVPVGETGIGEAASPLFLSNRDALEAVIARVVPDRNESSLGILAGRPEFVPGIAVDFQIQKDARFVQRALSEVSDGTVRRGTVLSSVGTLRYLATPIVVDVSEDPGVYITAINLDAELADLLDAFGTYTAVAIASLVAIGLAGWAVAGRLLNPIRSLRVAASHITGNNRGERIPVVGHDDVSELTRTVNDMLDRLDNAITSQRQLLDDVRHELMTPITIVRGHLELLDASRILEVQATRSLAIDELDRMVGLVDDIELLAESRVAVPTRQHTDAGHLTASVFAKAEGIPGHEWVLGGVARSIADLDSTRITQAWLQLIDNAVKFSPPGSPVTVGSTEHADFVEFWVQDAGPGIPPGAEDRIFERFRRIDNGRGVRGSGLGLSIVKAIVSGHGGHVTVVSSEAGSRFGLMVPLAEDVMMTAVSRR